MKLTRLELCCLRVADGIATEADKDRLRRAGESPENWESLSQQIRDVLRAPAIVDVSAVVMETLQREQELSSTINYKELLSDPKPLPDLVDSVMERVLSQESDAFKSDLQHFLLDQNPPQFVDSVMQQIQQEASLVTTNVIEEDPETILQEFVFAELQENISENEQLETSQELSSDDEQDQSLDIFPYLEEMIAERNNDPDQDISLEEPVVSEEQEEMVEQDLEDLLQEEVFLTVQRKLEEAEEEQDIQEMISVECDVINISEAQKQEEVIVERLPLNENTYIQEDDSDEEVLSILEPNYITETVLEEQQVRFSLHLQKYLTDDIEEGALDIWSMISSKIKQPPLQLVRDTVEENSEDKIVDSVVEEMNEKAEVSDGSVEFISTKTIDVDSTISKVSLWTLGALLAVAAAWLIAVLPQQTTNSVIEKETHFEAFEVAEVNQLEVEELEVANDVNVQIFQAGEDAPTIIFIDDLSEGEEE